MKNALQRSHIRQLFQLVGALALLLVAACGSRHVDTSIPLNEARVLNNELSGSYVRTVELMEHSAAVAAELGRLPDGVGAADFDVAMFRQVLEACFTQSVDYLPGTNTDAVPRRATAELGPDHIPLTGRTEVGRARPCAPPRLVSLESYIQVIDADLRAFLSTRILEVDALRVNLKDVLIAQLDDLDKRAGVARDEVVRLRELAEERRALSQTSGVSEESRRQTEIDYDAMLRELDQVQDVLAQVEEHYERMRTQRRQLIELAARAIAELGTP